MYIMATSLNHGLGTACLNYIIRKVDHGIQGILGFKGFEGVCRVKVIGVCWFRTVVRIMVVIGRKGN